MIRSFNKCSYVIQTQFNFMLAAESVLPLYIISILNYVVLLSEDNCWLNDSHISCAFLQFYLIKNARIHVHVRGHNVLWFSLFLMFSLARCSNVNSWVLTFVLVGFGGNLVQGFRVYPCTSVPSFPHIPLYFFRVAIRPQPLSDV